MPDTFPCNVIALSMQDLFTGAETAVQRDADGVPTAFRLFPLGPFTITKDGLTMRGELDGEKAAAIMAHHARKGVRIPIDCEHYSYQLAELAGLDEPELRERLKAENAAAGFANLALRSDGVWATDVVWSPRARLLLTEKTYRYFSPVVRGLRDGNLRITSIALTNTPALDQLDELVARAEAVEAAGMVSVADRKRAAAPATKGASMNKLLSALGALLGVTDAIALSDDGTLANEDTIVGNITKLRNEIQTMRDAQGRTTAFLDSVRESLALGAEGGLDVAQGKILALVEKSRTDSEALSAVTTRLEKLEADATAKERRDLIDKGLEEGKLTPAMVDSWASKQDTAVLKSFLESAMPVVSVGKSPDTKNLPKDDSVALSDTDQEVAKVLGIDEKDMAKTKKALRA